MASLFLLAPITAAPAIQVSQTQLCKSSDFSTRISAGRAVRIAARRIKMAVSNASAGVPEKGENHVLAISNKDGEKLAGFLTESGSTDLCVFCHGFQSSKASGTLRDIATALNLRGVSTFRFDFSGNGESDGEFSYANYAKEVADLRSVIEYWRQRGRGTTIIVGHSKGGNVVLLYASKYGDVPTVINVSGRCNMTNGVTERLGEDNLRLLELNGFVDILKPTGEVDYRVTSEALRERLAINMETAVSQIPATVRVLTIHGSADKTIPVEDARMFHKHISNHKLVVVDDADHNYRQHRQALVSAALEFLSLS